MNVYFSGIGGVGIGPLAEIAHDAGYTVMGSDLADSLMTSELRTKGITVSIGQDGTFLNACHAAAPLDWFVYTAALPYTHPELIAARALGIRTAKRDEFLAALLQEKKLKLIAVAGTHGKTTTTGMLIWAFKSLGIPASYSVGSTLSFGPSGLYMPESEYFIYECDEFDRNFLHFHAFLSILTSVDYDHPDTYPTVNSYREAFNQYVEQSRETIAWQRDLDYIKCSTPAETVQGLRPTDTLALSLPGDHNRRNGTLVARAIETLGIGSLEQAGAILALFPGTDRRFQCIAPNLYSDYGHHPAEIQATLQLAKEVAEASNRKVALIYQPHQNIRQHELRTEYTPDVFANAAMVYWLPTYLSREDPTLPILEPRQLTEQLAHNDTLHYASLDDALWKTIQKLIAENYLVVAMGAGSIDRWLREKI